MFLPKHFDGTNDEGLLDFCKTHSFATLIFEQEGLRCNHLPVVLKQSQESYEIEAHAAKANPDFKEVLSSQKCTVIFHGPHSYISPMWYPNQSEVPTWNYAVVHMHGILNTTNETDFLINNLRELVSLHDKEWSLDKNIDYVHKLLAGIVGIRIQIQEIQFKKKLSQHRPQQEISQVIENLQASGSEMALSLSKMMEEATP